MSPMLHGHVSSEQLGDAARHASLDGLSAIERGHVEGCERCRHLYAGYRMTDRLLSANWRQTSLPASALELNPIPIGIRGVLDGLSVGSGRRLLAMTALAACLVAVAGFGVLLPQLLPSPAPAASGSNAAAIPPSPSATLAATPEAVASATVGATAATPGTSTGPGQSVGVGPSDSPATGPGPVATPGPAATPVPEPPVRLASVGGWPIAWAPDGLHLLVARGSGWTNQQQIQIRDSAGGLSGSFSADHATWVDSRTIAAATQAGGGSGGNKGPGGSSVTVRLIDLNGNIAATIPGQYSEGGQSSSGAILLGSGTGYLGIASQGGWDSSQSNFVLWDGRGLSSPHAGMPMAFSRDGKRLAVLHPSAGLGGGSQGWLEIVSVPSLGSVASLSHTNVHVASQGNGPGYAPDVSFSPDGNSLLVSGTLVDLSRGSTSQVGEGGWLADGTLVTSNGGVVMRWPAGHATADARFAAGGTVEISRHGDAVEYFRDGRPPLLLAADGTFQQLNLPGIASLDDLSLAPDGGAVAISGRGTNGSRVTAVFSLP
jgi:hypothetical protein